MDAINTVYSLKDPFLKASRIPAQIKEQDMATWFLVTSVEHNKLLEAKGLQQQITTFGQVWPILLINRCASQHLANWTPHHRQLQELRSSLLTREQAILKCAQKLFPDYLQFEDISSKEPAKHLAELIKMWKVEEEEIELLER